MLPMSLPASPLAVIPVLDLRGGQVVHARRGQRERYAPIQSRLAPGSDPLRLAQALLQHSGSTRLYLADLDALQGGPVQTALLQRLVEALRAEHPGLRLWLDAGWPDRDAAHTLWQQLGAAATALDPVFASEALRDPAALAHCFDPQDALGRRALLSLDRRDGRTLDAAGAWQRPDLWPAQVIVMTLERVGSAAGPDLDTLAALRALAPEKQFIGSGGIRDAADLQAAATTGACGWLVASALHEGRLAGR